MTQRFAKWVTTHPILVLLIVILCIALLATGARFLSFSNDYRVFFSKDNPQLKAFDALQKTYTKSDNALIVVAPKNKNVFSKQTLKVVEQLTEAAWQTPYSTRVDSITNYQHTYVNGDYLVVEDLVTNAAELTEDQLASKKAIALNEPLIVDKVVSPEGHVTGVNISVYLPEKNSHQAIPEVAEFIRNFVKIAQQENPGLDIYLTGSVFMNNAFQEFSEADLKTLMPLTFIIIIFGLALLLRSFSATISTLVIILLAVSATMGLAGWLGIILTPSSVGAPTIIATLAIADCVHIITTFRFLLNQGNDKQSAIIESLELNFYPVFLTSMTTAVGFLTMNFSDAPPLHDLGNMAASGVLFAFMLSVIALPALLMTLPVRSNTGEEKLDNTMNLVARLVIHYRTPLFWVMLLMIVVLATFVPKNQLDDQFVEYFDESTSFRQATDFATDNLTGIYEIHYSLSAGESGGISNPEFLRTLESFTNWYRQQPNVLHVYSILDIMKRLNQNMHDNDPSWYRIPDRRELSAQYLLLYEMSLPYGLDLNDRINIDKSATRLTVTLDSLSSNDLLELEKRAQVWLNENAPESMLTDGTSPAVVFAHIGYRNLRSMLYGTAVALILISVILIFALRSLKMGLISLVPNLVPAIMAFGIWGLTVGQIGFAMSVVASMCLGIVVDDTVHFLSKYLYARRTKNMSAEDSVHYAFSTVGRALWTTSLVLISGFLILSMSDFEFNSGTGALTAITFACALMTDFFFLPPLLLKFDKYKARRVTN